MNLKKGFTLIELLAVIIILGVLMLIAIPSVTEYIGVSRRKAYIEVAGKYIDGARLKVNSLELPFTNVKTMYYVPYNCIKLEKGGKSPFGDWKEAYVVVTIEGDKYNYYWTSVDSSGYGMELSSEQELTEKLVVPRGGVPLNTTTSKDGATKKVLLDKDTCLAGSSVSVTYEGTANPILMALSEDQSSETFLNFTESVSNQIGEIRFVNHKNIPEGYITSDVSQDQDGSVMAWYDSGFAPFVVFVGSEGGVVANALSPRMFYNTRATKIDLTHLDTSNTTLISGMFCNASGITNIIGLDELDLSNVTTAKWICLRNLVSANINLGKWNTAKIADMEGWFYESSATTLNLKGWNTSKVTVMAKMFYKMTNLVEVDLSTFDFSKVISYDEMFKDVPTSVKIIVKDSSAKAWLNSKFPTYTNVVITP